MLARGPVDHITALAYAAVDTANLGVVSRFEIPAKVPPESTMSLQELAVATGLPENELARIVRYAITNGIFTEPEKGRFGHSAASATLAKNKGLADMTLFNSGFSTRIVVCLADALWARYGAKLVDAPEAAFNEGFPGFVNLFDYMAKSSIQSREYFNYLDGRSQLPRYALDNVARSWDWESIRSGTIVDAGGSSGGMAVVLAKLLPEARLVVEDINVEGLKMGEELVKNDPALAGRIKFLEHDLFNEQPVSANAYFFRHVLHDWPDDECIKMIRALLPAIKDKASVLVSEGVIPDKSVGRSVLLEDMHVLWDDHVMLAAHNARERTVGEYTKLFQAADPGFRYTGTGGRTSGVHHALIEFQFDRAHSSATEVVSDATQTKPS